MKASKLTTIIIASIISAVVLFYCVYRAVDKSNHYEINVTICYGENEKEQYRLEAGQSLLILETPEKDGFTFAGWYADENFTQEYDIHSKIKKDICIYAKFESAS